MKDFVDLLRQAKNGDENAILEYIDRFKPLLKKYANRLRYEDAYNDLQLKLIEVLKASGFQPEKLSCGQAVSYIHRSIVNEYICLNKCNVAPEILLNDLSEEQQHMVKATYSIDTSYDEFEIGSMLEMLSPTEKEAVRRIVLEHETAAQLARELGCTRQSINQAKLRGLKKLKKSLLR